MPDPAGCTFAVAKLSGATTIIATERFPHRAAMAKHYGADEVLQCPLDEASAAVKKSTGGRGCDVVFEVAGAVDTPTAAASMCKKGGTLCVVGICAADSVSSLQTLADELFSLGCVCRSMAVSFRCRCGTRRRGVRG